MRIITVGKNDAGQRLDKFLAKALPGLPVSMSYKFIRTKKIKVNRKRAEPGMMLAEGDTLQLFIAEDFFQSGGKPGFIKTLIPHITAAYEDMNIIVCDKPAGILTHSDDNEDTNTLINHIKAYLYRNGEYDPDTEQSFAPALCNRIDRNTAGLVIAAKNAEALRVMNALIRDGKVTKKYICVAHGLFEKKTDTLHGFLTKDGDENLVTVYKTAPKDMPRDQVKTIVTKYSVLGEKGTGAKALSLLEVELLTGRTHQIRAHLASVGHPLLGDGKYGNIHVKGMRHQALCAYKLHIPPAPPIDEIDVTIPPSDIWFYNDFINS